jgi:hypothetical protein
MEGLETELVPKLDLGPRTAKLRITPIENLAQTKSFMPSNKMMTHYHGIPNIINLKSPYFSITNCKKNKKKICKL